MALLIRTAFKGYRWIFEDLRDPRTDHLPLMSSPIPICVIAFGYLGFVNKWGPNFMKNRQPFQLEKILLIFNLLQVFFNTYMVVQGTPALLRSNLRCTPVDYSDGPEAMKILYLGYGYFWLKFADLLDTVFFILRKKDNQVTFLHVYHHFGMFICVWIAVKFFCGGHSIYLAYINGIVHAVMYSYYLLTSWDAKYKKSIWWKKHITQLQLIQFTLVFSIYGSILFRSDCSYPKIISYFLVPQNIFMVCLFGDFYYKAYIKPKKTQAAKQ